MRSPVTSIFLYVCELWTLTTELQRNAMEMRWYCKILCSSYKDHVINKEVCAKIQQAIGPQEDFLTIVKRCKLQWYVHVSHSSGLAKTILQSTVEGGRRQDRQREEIIREWTGLEFTESQRAVENREEWRKLVVKSSVVPQQSSQKRDRWGEEVNMLVTHFTETLAQMKQQRNRGREGLSPVCMCLTTSTTNCWLSRTHCMKLDTLPPTPKYSLLAATSLNVAKALLMSNNVLVTCCCFVCLTCSLVQVIFLYIHTHKRTYWSTKADAYC